MSYTRLTEEQKRQRREERRKDYAQRKLNHTQLPNIVSRRTCKIISGNGYWIGNLSEEVDNKGNTDWAIEINWEQYDKAGKPPIAGIDTEKRRKVEYRRYIPAIVTQRTLPDNRENLYEELSRVGLEENDRFEFMCRTHGLCSNSRLTIER